MPRQRHDNRVGMVGRRGVAPTLSLPSRRGRGIAGPAACKVGWRELLDRSLVETHLLELQHILLLLEPERVRQRLVFGLLVRKRLDLRVSLC